eukprot:3477228-Pleurochrysis_carterae.AAC.1
MLKGARTRSCAHMCTPRLEESRRALLWGAHAGVAAPCTRAAPSIQSHRFERCLLAILTK